MRVETSQLKGKNAQPSIYSVEIHLQLIYVWA